MKSVLPFDNNRLFFIQSLTQLFLSIQNALKKRKKKIIKEENLFPKRVDLQQLLEQLQCHLWWWPHGEIKALH